MHNIDYRYLRPLKAKALEKLHNNNFSEIGKNSGRSLDIWYGKNATVLPVRKSPDPIVLFGAGGVADFNKNYIELSCIDGRVTGGYDFETAEYKDLKVVYCGFLVDQWGHFLIETVSRLWYFLEHNDETIDKYVFTLRQDEVREINGNYKEFLSLIGIWDKMEIVNTPTTYREVIVPEVSYYRTRFYSQEFKDTFKAVADNVSASERYCFPEKIYFSRGQLSKAQKLEPGTDALDNYFAKNGFTLLYPENLSLSQLILYIRNAKVCASVSGTLPHNMLFGDDGQKLVILERNAVNNEIQCELNIAKKLEVTYIDSNFPIYSVNPSYGPFIVGYSAMLKKYTEDNKMCAPDAQYTNEKYMQQCFIAYMKAYFEKYHYQWYMDDWFVNDTAYIYEGYLESFEIFKDYLRCTKPFKPSHKLTMNPVYKRAKRLVKMFTK